MDPLFLRLVELFSFVSRWMWAGFILASLPTMGAVYLGGRYLRARRPGWGALLMEGAKLAFIAGNLPWLVMGIGIHVGGVPSMHHFIAGGVDDPSIALFYASMVVPALIIVAWLLRQDLVGWLRAQGVTAPRLRAPVLAFKGFVLANAALFTAQMVFLALWRPPIPMHLLPPLP
ncbi:MAG: hypothetical protein H6741_05240 [Alphaproteobacteria bacterium]|nr:hypothetical protein [Alphaproteobacteria bacterium]MCB9792111.1 hypothetical protein [Alphaproteobacteria bacterium]